MSTIDLRESNGDLSINRIADLFGLNQADFIIDDSTQNVLLYFERVALLRNLFENDDEFRKWLRCPNPAFNDTTPLELLLQDDKLQSMADAVDDILTGNLM
ncbi:MAG: MbcA/ParS/Xre antitoxin family protein [Candidatus Magasanikbacteria bacterium]|nr:MbcA/ParS/Xre antitoxin family protein [Candidatus Magasanikbacteria bacterium]